MRNAIREEIWRRERCGTLERFVDCGFHAPPRHRSRTAQAGRRIPEVSPERTMLRSVAPRVEPVTRRKCEGYLGAGAVLWAAVNVARRLKRADAAIRGSL